MSAQATVIVGFGNTHGGIVAGEERFLIDGSSVLGRFVTTGIGDEGQEVHSRPAVQQLQSLTIGSAAADPLGSDSALNDRVGKAIFGTTGSRPTYFESFDFVQGKFGFDNNFNYFHVDLFGEMNVGADGRLTADLGERRLYRIRIREDAAPAGGVMLSGEVAAGDSKAEFKDNTEEYKTVSHGKIGGKNVRYTRKLAEQLWAELAFDYVAFNNQRGTELDPTDGLLIWISRPAAALTASRATIEAIKARSTKQSPPSSMPAVFKAAAPSSSPKPVPASPAISRATSKSSIP